MVLNGKVWPGSRGLVEGGHQVGMAMKRTRKCLSNALGPCELLLFCYCIDRLSCCYMYVCVDEQIVERNGRLCGCGQRGCLETYTSATSVVSRAREAIKENGMVYLTIYVVRTMSPSHCLTSLSLAVLSITYLPRRIFIIVSVHHKCRGGHDDGKRCL